MIGWARPRRAPWRTTAVLGLLTACGSPPPSTSPVAYARPTPPAEADAVLFLVGDAGEARRERSPLLHRLRADVEHWSSELSVDSAVVVAFLGDNVYPEGVRSPGTDDFPEDSARLHGQVWTVDGPAAHARGTRGIFLPGNHDWGNFAGAAGLARLAGMERELAATARSGAAVGLVPGGGSPGPVVLALGRSARIVAVDTQWWLQSRDPGARTDLMRDLKAVLESPDARPVILLAHHPYVSAGEHGQGSYSPISPLWLLHRAGALVQDASSRPYRSLTDALSEAFSAAGPPLVYAAGHDHGLQVLQGTSATEPKWSLISAAGSRLSAIGTRAGLVWAARRAGYMRLVFRSDGGVEVQIEASASRGVVECPHGIAGEACLGEGVAAFATRYVVRAR